MKMYYDKDIDMKTLANKTIAVIGYGSQGMGQSQNMADSGLNVIVGLREGGASWKKAKDDGMNVKTIEDAAKEADIIHILLPDEIQADVYEKSIEPFVEAGNTISFSHGYNIHFKYIKAPKDVKLFTIPVTSVPIGVFVKKSLRRFSISSSMHLRRLTTIFTLPSE